MQPNQILKKIHVNKTKLFYFILGENNFNVLMGDDLSVYSAPVYTWTVPHPILAAAKVAYRIFCDLMETGVFL